MRIKVSSRAHRSCSVRESPVAVPAENGWSWPTPVTEYRRATAHPVRARSHDTTHSHPLRSGASLPRRAIFPKRNCSELRG